MNPGDGNGKIYVGIPRERVYLTQFVDNRDQLLARLHTSGVGVGYYQAEGHRVDRNRDKITFEFLNHKDQPEWLVMIDTDMEHVEDLPERLVRWQKPIVAGLYFHRGQSHDPFAFRNGPTVTDQYGRDHRSWAPMRDEVYDYLLAKGIPLRDGAIAVNDGDDRALVECDAVATGAICIHRSVFEAMMPGPWWEYEAGGISEDLTFCAKAKEVYGFPIYCDFSTISGHYNWVAMGQSQFRMNYENRGINLTSYTKRFAAGMWKDFWKIESDEQAIKEIEEGNAHVAGDLWRATFGDRTPTPEEEKAWYASPEAGKAYLMELLYWNYTPDFTMLRQTLTHLRRQNIIEIGAGIGSVALQMIVQLNNCLAVEINQTLRDFIKMRADVLIKNVETGLGEMSIVGEEWMEKSEDASFHTAIAIDTLEHLPEPDLRLVIQNVARVLQLNGHFIFHINWHQQELYPMHHDYHELFNELLRESGFVPVSTMEAIKMR